eukprot:7553131-Pyramimonas_sp.AAC.1
MGAPTAGMIFALLSSKPRPAWVADHAKWPQRPEAQRRRRSIDAQCHYYLRGAALVYCATLEDETRGGRRAVLYFDPG